MTDKSKPWLTSDHPEAKPVIEAGERLVEALRAQGLNPTGSGVTVSADGQSAAIFLMVRKKGDLSKIPKTYEGHEVIVQVVSRIVPI